jgi:hypothetical protein
MTLGHFRRKINARFYQLRLGRLHVAEAKARRGHCGGENVDFECKGLWLLKNSCFAKTAEIWEIENVYRNGDRRL